SEDRGVRPARGRGLRNGRAAAARARRPRELLPPGGLEPLEPRRALPGPADLSALAPPRPCDVARDRDGDAQDARPGAPRPTPSWTARAQVTGPLVSIVTPSYNQA